MHRINIDKEQTNLIKGIGILLIIFHNYFHWVSPSPGENEFIFSVTHVKNTFSILSNSHLDILNDLFSFFGHYGVQLFIFISAYGLTRSQLNKPYSYIPFLKKRALKIYPTFIIGIVVLIAYNAIIYAYIPNFGWIARIGSKLLMVHTFIPDEAISINGPWWFYGLITHLYLLFIPLLYIIKRYNWKGFLLISAISYISIYTLYQPLLNHQVYVMANAVAHLPEFALGIILALNPHLKFRKTLLTIAMVIFIAGNFNYAIFPFTFLAITYILVITILKIFKKRNTFSTVLVFYGQLSMYLFAIHGFFRKPYFTTRANASDSAIKSIAYGILYLITVTIVAYLCHIIYTLIQDRFRTNKGKRHQTITNKNII